MFQGGKEKNMKKIGTVVLTSLLIGVGVVSCGSTSSQATTSQNNYDVTKAIKVYTRDTSSGTREGFFEKINLKDAAKDNSLLVNGVIETSGNGDMKTKIQNDEYGIGYISLGSLDSSLNGLTYEGVKPTEENVLNGTYKLTRNFNYITRKDDSSVQGQIVKAFVAYMGTKEGKATIASESGIVSITSDDKSWDEIKANYPVCAQDNSKVTVYFGGSTSVDKICDALATEFSAKCGNFIANHNHTGSGDAYKYTQGSAKDDAAKLDIGFLSREIKLTDSEPASEGTYGKICVDAIVAVTNTKNPLTSITADDLNKIYTGAYTKWSDLIK